MIVTSVWGCGAAAPSSPDTPAAPVAARADEQIITPRVTGSARELRERATAALLREQWQEAIEVLEALRAAATTVPGIELEAVLSDLGFAYEGASRLDEAWTVYEELAGRGAEHAEQLERRRLFLAVYTVRREELVRLSDAARARPHRGREQLTALWSAALVAVQRGDDVAAMRLAHDGLELADSLGLGQSGRLPLDVAMLYFSLAEARRTRSERRSFEHSSPAEFMQAFEARCTEMMSAQDAYSEAVRSEDPRVAVMSSVVVGEMYQSLHRDVLAVPPSKRADTEAKRQLHSAIMHVRYRVLLEKARDTVGRALALGERRGEQSVWLQRAELTKQRIDQAIEAEHQALRGLPYSEEEVEKAIEILRRQAMAKLAAEEERRSKQWKSAP